MVIKKVFVTQKSNNVGFAIFRDGGFSGESQYILEVGGVGVWGLVAVILQ